MDGELCRGRVMHVWELETVPALQYVIRLDDPDFIHLELRDALMSSERAGALRLVASNSLAKPTPNFWSAVVDGRVLSFLSSPPASGGTVMLWDRGSGRRWKALRKGELKFTLVGARRLQGAWVLVRLRHDRERGKRTNWLLIKRHDGYEKEGDADSILDEGRSVASGRSMDDRRAAACLEVPTVDCSISESQVSCWPPRISEAIDAP